MPARMRLPRLAAAALLAGALVAACAGGPVVTPPPSSTASGGVTTLPDRAAGSPTPTPMGGTRPYRLALVAGSGTLGTPATITAPTDCAPLPTAWLRQVCALTLRADWRAIVAPGDPLGGSADQDSPSWTATMTRAEIDGDISLCPDVTMRAWFTLGSTLGGAASPGATPAPLRPVASCLALLDRVATAGSFLVTDTVGQASVQVIVDPAAATRIATATAPAFDPGVACNPPLTRDACTQLVEAATAALDGRQAQVTLLSAYATPVRCVGQAGACPAPTAGTWLGGVLAVLGGGTGVAFDVARSGGQLRITESAYQPSP